MIPNQAPDNDSTAAGFLQPTDPQPPNQLPAGRPLEDYLQQYVAGLAYLDGQMVRPRWQEEPANLPDYGVDWCAVGITRIAQIGIYGATIWHPLGNQGDGYAEMQRHEEFDILCTFYGHNASYYADNLQDNLNIWQNKSALVLAGMGFVETKDQAYAPELIRQRWWPRYDLTITMRRIVRRNYNVLSLLEAAGWIKTDTGYSIPWSTAKIGGGPILPPPYEPPVIGGGPIIRP